jgi:hypothetical protein
LQLSTAGGTMIQVGDTSEIGGYQTNYYLDDATEDPEDTGDQLSFGDTGVYIDDPNDSFTYPFSLYFLPGAQPNLGEQYEAYFFEPLSTVVQEQPLDQPEAVYLPLIASSR